jgi:hypothetical protein
MPASASSVVAALLDPNVGNHSSSATAGNGKANLGSTSITLSPVQDVLVLRVSEDAFKGHAMFTVFLDGVQQAGIMTAQASHAQQRSDRFEFEGPFGPGPHDLTIRYLNDYSEGSAPNDRNLYIDQIEYNGADLHQSVALLLSGDAIFHF